MPEASQSGHFVRLLTEELEAERFYRKVSLAMRAKARAEEYRQLFQSDLSDALPGMEPLRRIPGQTDIRNRKIG